MGKHAGDYNSRKDAAMRNGARRKLNGQYASKGKHCKGPQTRPEAAEWASGEAELLSDIMGYEWELALLSEIVEQEEMKSWVIIEDDGLGIDDDFDRFCDEEDELYDVELIIDLRD